MLENLPPQQEELDLGSESGPLFEGSVEEMRVNT